MSLKQESNYPFDGQVKIELELEEAKKFEIRLRIPTWCRSDQFVPGKLYSYSNIAQDKWKVSVNGKKVEASLENGFAVLYRKWTSGDQILLELPMPVRINATIENVAANRERMAVTRGPLVYAAEGLDNEREVQQYFMEDVPPAAQISEQRIEAGILKNVVKINLPSKMLENNEVTSVGLKMIPYYAWDNRGHGSMIVWLPNTKKGVH